MHFVSSYQHCQRIFAECNRLQDNVRLCKLELSAMVLNIWLLSCENNDSKYFKMMQNLIFDSGSLRTTLKKKKKLFDTQQKNVITHYFTHFT